MANAGRAERVLDFPSWQGNAHPRTTQYYPQGNGQVKCFDPTLLSTRYTLPEKQKSHWKDHLNKIVHGYNCEGNETTGYSPFFLLFGHQPRFPVDVIFDSSQPRCRCSYPQYVETWQKAMSEACELADQKVNLSASKAKQLYDCQLHYWMLQPGD